MTTTPVRSRLNDLSDFTRWSIAGQLFGPAVALGGIVGAALADSLATALLTTAIGLVLMVAWLVMVIVLPRRWDRALREEVRRGSAELLDGSVPPVPAVGRVVRRRIARTSPGFLAGAGETPAPGAVVVITALGPGPARRVAALVPAHLALGMRRQPVVIGLHPTRPDVAVLDERVTPDVLARVDADPRWTSAELPTDRSVAGGWAPVVLYAVAGLVAGGLVGVGIAFLAS